jgi:hypothetical protein
MPEGPPELTSHSSTEASIESPARRETIPTAFPRREGSASSTTSARSDEPSPSATASPAKGAVKRIRDSVPGAKPLGKPSTPISMTPAPSSETPSGTTSVAGPLASSTS